MMGRTRNKSGRVVFTCGQCGRQLQSGKDEFEDAKKVFDADGWKVRQVQLEIVDLCPKCDKKLTERD